MDLRKQERILFSVREYDKAESLRIRADRLEERERAVNMAQSTNEELLRNERSLRKRQQMALSTLLKRI